MSHHTSARVLTAVGVGLALATALPGHASAAPTPRPSVPPPVMRAMQRDLGLTKKQVTARLSDEATARQVASRVRTALAGQQAGLWYDAHAGRIVVAVTTTHAAAQARALGAQPKTVRHSQADLARALKTVAVRTRGVVGWGVDPVHNQVVVRVDGTPHLGRLGDLVRVERTAAQHQQAGDVRGGDKWTPGSESPCSIAFSASGSDGKHFLTAGHCTNDVNQPAYGVDGSRVGTSNTGGTHSVNAREGDFGLVDVDQAGWNLTPKVNTYGSADVLVTGSAEPVTGMSICHSGQTSGWKCGSVTAVNQTIDYGNVIIDGLFVTNACSAGGDSGGSYVTGDKAVGIHSGGGNVCGQSNPNTNAQPVNEALAKWNLTLTTGGGQPGDVTVTAPGAQSGVTGQAVSLPNSASGGTAPYTWTATGLPAGLSIDASTGTISGTPSAAGSSGVTVTAKDSAGKTGSATFTWTITTPGGGTPTVTSPGYQNAYIGTPVNLQIQATNATSYAAKGLPAGLSINASTGLITGTPTTWGLYNSTVTVTGGGKKATTTFSWSVWS